MSSTKDRQICCSMCKTMAKSIFYLCHSGRHVICENCQFVVESTKNNNDDKDYIPEKECAPAAKKELAEIKNPEKQLDLASGDHADAFETIKVRENNMKLSTSTPKEQYSKCDIETTVKYKNERFRDSRSSVITNIVSASNVCEEDKNCERDLRPVVCPITNCARIVTIDTISQHFNFDHSKVPRMILNKTGPQEMSIPYSMFSTDTKCVASFIISQKRPSKTAVKRVESKTSLQSLDKDSKLLLLMVAKIPSTIIKLRNAKSYSRISTRNSSTQTADTQMLDNQSNKLCVSKNSSVNTAFMKKSNKVDDEDELILLWLCKLDDRDRVYNITATREDKKQGYSYTGDAVHIRNSHDPLSIFRRAACLSIRRIAINKLVTTNNELKVIVSTLL